MATFGPSAKIISFTSMVCSSFPGIRRKAPGQEEAWLLYSVQVTEVFGLLEAEGWVV
jgi:hypothetical protein